MKVIILAAGSGERFRQTGVSTPKPLLHLCGMSLLERTIRTASKAGATEFLVVLGSEANTIQTTLAPRLSGLTIHWIVNDHWRGGNGTSMLAAAPFVKSESVLVLMADHLVFPSTLQRLWQAAKSGTSVMAVDSKLAGLADPEDATKVSFENGRITAIGKELQRFNAYDTGMSVCSPEYFQELALASKEQEERCSHTDGMRRLVASGRLQAWDIGLDRWEDVDSPAAHKAAEDILFQSLRKPTDGFMSRHLERRLSGWITRRLMNTAVTPNLVTTGIIAIGALAAFFFSQPGYGPKVAGALLFWCSSFLDGCDGELARLKFAESRLGGWLDLWADNLVHMMVFAAIGIGLWRDTQNSQWILLGLTAAAGVLLSVGWISWNTLRQKRGDGPLFTSVADGNEKESGWAGRLTRLADALSRRDFIFGVIFLALLEWLPAFLWAAAVGSHAYWILLVILRFSSGAYQSPR